MDPNPQDNTDLSLQYQAILDKYAQELKSLNSAAENNPEPAISPALSPPPTAPDLSPPPALVETLPPIALEPSAPPVVSSVPVSPTISAAKSSPDMPAEPHKSSSSIFRYFFYLSVIIFLGVVSLIAYTLFTSGVSGKKPALIPDNTPKLTPTAGSQKFCEVNDNKYKQGESFSAADGCNTCTCTADLTISCTEKSCDGAKEVLEAVKVTPTIKLEAGPTVSLSAVKSACLQNQFTWLTKYSECETAVPTDENKNKLKSICDIFKGKFEETASSCRHISTPPCGPEAVALCSFAN